jgi:hypothetical protein
MIRHYGILLSCANFWFVGDPEVEDSSGRSLGNSRPKEVEGY